MKVIPNNHKRLCFDTSGLLRKLLMDLNETIDLKIKPASFVHLRIHQSLYNKIGLDYRRDIHTSNFP